MGIFDALTGAPAKRATEENLARLGQLRTDGLSYLDAGKTGALSALDDASAAYAPLGQLGQKYGGATTLGLDSLGVNGADGTARARAAFTSSPGYDWQLGQGLDAINRRRAAGGMLNSGNADIDALTYGQGLAQQDFGNWQNKLLGFTNPELSAVSGAASGQAGVAGNRAGVYMNDAGQRVNLASGVTSGQNSAATQGANAEMAASGNLLNLGMGLASLGAGGFGGGGGLFGGFGGTPDYGQARNVSYGGVNMPVFGR